MSFRLLYAFFCSGFFLNAGFFFFRRSLMRKPKFENLQAFAAVCGRKISMSRSMFFVESHNVKGPIGKNKLVRIAIHDKCSGDSATAH